MKKILALLMALAVCVGMLSVTAYAAGGSVSTSSATVERGKSVSLTVSIGSNPGVSNMTCTVNYEESAMTLDSIDPIDLGAGDWTNGSTPFWDAMENDTSTGQILKLNFTVKSDAAKGDYPVSVSIEAFNLEEEEVPFSVNAGTVTVTIPLCANHDFDEGVVTKPSSCESAGVRTYTCEICGFEKTETISASHKWGEWEPTAATCDKEGSKTRTCSACGDTETEKTADATGHAWGAWTQTKAPGCETKGEETRTCGTCNKTETRAVDDTGHKEDKWVKVDDTQHKLICKNDATHTLKTENHTWDTQVTTLAPSCVKGNRHDTCKCGAQRDVELDPTGKHATEDWTDSKDGENHHGKCDGCGKDLSDGHNLIKDEVVDPDCVNAGKIKYHCKDCNAKVEVPDKPATGKHSYTVFVSKDATSHTYKCSGCDATETKDHAWNKGQITTAATCKDTGVMTSTCTTKDCGQTKTETVPVTNKHSYGAWAAVEGTDNHERVCTVCTVAKETKAHDWKPFDKVLPSCVAEGKNTYKCSLCPATKEETVPVDESAHDYAYAEGDASGHRVSCKNEGCDLKPHTEEHDMHETNKVENGKRVWECAGCGHKELVKIPVNAADLDDVPKTGDITGQIVAFVICGMAAMMGVVFTFKRKAAK